MKPKTLKALKGSIVKWERILRSPKAHDRGADNCALCEIFLKNDCIKCPVRNATERNECLDSPWTPWAIHQDNAHSRCFSPYFREPFCKECMRLAKKELAFLESLLPKEKK